MATTSFVLKTALTIAGSDSGGGAGIQADLKVFTVLNVYGTTAVTAVTAQNTLGVREVLSITPQLVAKQVDVVAGDLDIDATKTGMLGSIPVIEAVADAISRNKLQPYVCDPVMFAKSGDRLLGDSDEGLTQAVAVLRKKLLPLAAVVTPNQREAAALAGIETPGDAARWSLSTAKDAARRIIDTGAKAVVIKAIAHGEETVDVLFDGREFLEFAGPTQPSDKTHGSGCAFSAAITAGLAQRMGLVDAIDQAKQLVNTAIQFSAGQGRGIAPINVLAFGSKGKK